MSRTEHFAVKYLLIGLGIGLINFIAAQYSGIIILKLGIEDPAFGMKITYEILKYSSNIAIGLFVMTDSIKYLKNKLAISILGFCIPIFGVCFLIIENLLIEKTDINER